MSRLTACHRVLRVVGLALAGLGLACVPGAAASARVCGPRGSHLIAHNSAVEVTAQRADSGRVAVRHYYGVYACWHRAGRRTRLDSPLYDESVYTLRLAGRYLAYGFLAYSEAAAGESLAVLDTRTGRVYTVAESACGECNVFRDAVLRPSSAVAFIIEEQGQPAVVARCSPGCVRANRQQSETVDSGDIDLTSLRLSGSGFAWTNGGIEHTSSF
jgi:hypothetical protein